MTYSAEEIARTLRNAREARGLSQRALSAKAGIPQGHTLEDRERCSRSPASQASSSSPGSWIWTWCSCPARPSPPCRQSSGGASRPRLPPSKPVAARLNEFQRLQDMAARATRARPTVLELAQISSARSASFGISRSPETVSTRSATQRRRVRAFHENTAGLDALHDALAQLRDLRNALAHALPRKPRDPERCGQRTVWMTTTMADVRVLDVLLHGTPIGHADTRAG